MMLASLNRMELVIQNVEALLIAHLICLDCELYAGIIDPLTYEYCHTALYNDLQALQDRKSQLPLILQPLTNNEKHIRQDH